jgi:hypothetical protein
MIDFCNHRAGSMMVWVCWWLIVRIWKGFHTCHGGVETLFLWVTRSIIVGSVSTMNTSLTRGPLMDTIDTVGNTGNVVSVLLGDDQRGGAPWIRALPASTCRLGWRTPRSVLDSDARWAQVLRPRDTQRVAGHPSFLPRPDRSADPVVSRPRLGDVHCLAEGIAGVRMVFGVEDGVYE